MNQVGHVARELERRADGRAPQPMIDVRRGFVGVERLQVIAHRHPLPQLLELGAREQIPQVRLADQDDLNQLRFLGLEVREHPHFFERRQAQVLRFVDDQQRQPTGHPLIDQIPRQIAQQVRLAPALTRARARNRA